MNPCLSDIRGREAAKRAIEVAAVLPHPLRLVGPGGCNTEQLVDIAQELAVFEIEGIRCTEKALHFLPCPCGWLGDPLHECTCTPRMLDAYRRDVLEPYRFLPGLWVEVPRPAWGELHSPPGEPTETVLERVRAARSLPTPSEWDEAAQRLAQAAYERLGLTPVELENARSVAGSCARLSRDSKIRAPHIAEALAYRTGGLRKGSN